jgi:hypothetical protein
LDGTPTEIESNTSIWGSPEESLEIEKIMIELSEKKEKRLEKVKEKKKKFEKREKEKNLENDRSAPKENCETSKGSPAEKITTEIWLENVESCDKMKQNHKSFKNCDMSTKKCSKLVDLKLNSDKKPDKKLQKDGTSETSENWKKIKLKRNTKVTAKGGPKPLTPSRQKQEKTSKIHFLIKNFENLKNTGTDEHFKLGKVT